MCYIIDKSKGVVTHEELHNIMNEVLQNRKDVKLLEIHQQQIQQPMVMVAQPPPAYSPQQQFAPPPQQQYVQQPPQVAPQQQQQQQQRSGKFCNSCGAQNAHGRSGHGWEEFCMSCGASQ